MGEADIENECADLPGSMIMLNKFKGHGFKFGPIIGKLLCELSLGKVPSYDLSPFRIRRFEGKTKSAL